MFRSALPCLALLLSCAAPAAGRGTPAREIKGELADEAASDAVVCGDERDECKEGCTLEFGASTDEREKLGRCLLKCEGDWKRCPGKRLEARKVKEKQEKEAAQRKAKEEDEARQKAKTRPYEPRPAQLPEELRRADTPK